MVTYIEIVDKDHSYNIGGSCANCNESTHGDNMVRTSIKYESQKEILIEPFNVCSECYEQIKAQTE
jgi:hypothetical protein